MPNSNWQELINDLNIHFPSGFSFEENQQRLREFTLQDWYSAVQSRRTFDEILKLFDDPTTLKRGRLWQRISKEEFSNIYVFEHLQHDYSDVRTPDEKAIRPLSLRTQQELNAILELADDGSPGEVLNLDKVLDLRSMHRVLDPKVVSKMRPEGYKRSDIDSLSISELKSDNIISELASFKPIGETEFLEVDFSSPDNIIMAEFEEYLKSVRGRNGALTKRKSISQSTLSNWITSNALLYIDIRALAKINGLRIKDEDYGKILFPKEYGVSLIDRVRSTVKKHAKTILAEETEAALLAQLRTDNG